MISRIKNFWQGSLRIRLLGYALLLTLATTVSATFLTYELSRNALKNAVVDRLETAATLKESEFNRWIQNREQEITLLSQEPALLIQADVLLTSEKIDPFYSPSYQGLSAYLNNIVETNTNFSEIFILTNVGGETIFSTAPASEGKYHVTAPYFTEGRKGFFTQNIYPSVESGLPIMTLATPIINREGVTIGVLAAHLNMRKLDEIILEQAGLGESGETYLVDQYGNFVSQAKFGMDEFPRGIHTLGIDRAVSFQDGSALYSNYREVPVVGVYKWIDDREVALLAETSQEEAFAPAQQLALTTFWVGLSVTLAAGLLIYLLTQQITKPILAIANTAAKVVEGNLETEAPVMTKDEIGTLAKAFNNVTAQAQDLINTLEQRVAERTQDLEVRSSYLEGAAEVSRVATTFTDAEQLSRQVVDLIKERFDLYYVGLFLTDQEKEWAVLKAGTGKAGEKMLADNHRLQLGEGMIGWAVQYGESRIALDVGEDAVRFDNPILPETHSEGALPLRSRGRVLGALTVQSEKSAAFTPEIITTLQTMADQIAIAFDNAELIAEKDAALEAERRAYAEQSYASWKEIKERAIIPAYEMTAYGTLKELGQYDAATQKLDKEAMIQEDGMTALLPIKIRERVIGGIRVTKKKEQGAWTTGELRLADTLAEQLSVALESARLFEQTQQRAQREAVISDISAKIGASIRMDTIIQTTVRELGEALDASEIAFLLAETEQQKTRPANNKGEE